MVPNEHTKGRPQNRMAQIDHLNIIFLGLEFVCLDLDRRKLKQQDVRKLEMRCKLLNRKYDRSTSGTSTIKIA